MGSQRTDLAVELSAGGVALVELRRPPDNYFDVELIAAIADAYDSLAATPGCRAIVLCAEGRNFCAGADLRGTDGHAGAAFDPGELYRHASRLVASPLPVVAAIQGAAVGGGLGLACTADARVATPQSRFRANFVRLGINHGFGLTVTLPRIVGPHHTRLLLLEGAELDAEGALRLGLCDGLAAAPSLREAAHAMAARLGGGAPLATRATKTLLDGGLVAAFEAATSAELASQRALFSTRDFQEGVSSLAERRDPSFEGR